MRMGKRQVSVPVLLGLMVVVGLASATTTWAAITLKTIRGTALVVYKGDVTIEDFKFVDDDTVSVTISTTASPTPACMITIGGAGISSAKNIQSGWASPLTVDVTITGALTEGTITIEVTA